MARLFGLIGNRPDLAGRILGLESEALRVRSSKVPNSAASATPGPSPPLSPQASPLGWGMGFYQGGEVLMRRRPIDDREEIDVAKLAGDVRADLLIGHVRSATVGALRTENTHPFRYRQWLFAMTGTVAQFESVRDRLIASVPEFLRGNIRGETDSEIVFHVFLSFLHDAGRLNDAVVPENAVRDALRSSLSVVDGMAAEVGGEPSKVNLLVANGDVLIGVQKGDRMSYRVLSGKNDADMIIGEDNQLRRRAPELANMHFTLAASDFDVELPPRWKPLAPGAIMTMTRGDAPRIEAL
jgi:predicted glutamine amidotransferase